MLYAHGPDLCRESDLRHAMANCFEALIGNMPLKLCFCWSNQFGERIQFMWKLVPEACEHNLDHLVVVSTSRAWIMLSVFHILGNWYHVDAYYFLNWSELICRWTAFQMDLRLHKNKQKLACQRGPQSYFWSHLICKTFWFKYLESTTFLKFQGLDSI